MSNDERIDRVRAVFDDWAKRGRAEGMEEGHGPAARQAFDRLDLGPSSRYLDVGCGNGYTVRWAAERCPEGTATGLDLAPEMIARAREMSRDFENASFRVASFPDVDLEDGSFDGIFSMEAYYYFPDLDAALARTAALLAPAGRFACVVDYYEENAGSHGWPADLGVAMTRLSAEQWRDAFVRAGLAVESQERLRTEAPEAGTDWKVTAGSLFTLGRKSP